MIPDTARHILVDTVEQAIAEATNKVNEDGRPHYVCCILYKVEEMSKPCKITKIEDVE